MGHSSEMRQFAEKLKPGINLVSGQGLQPFSSKAFHGERAHHSSIEQGPLKHLAIQFVLRSEVAHKSAGKGIAGSGGILHFLDGKRWGTEWMRSDAERPFAKKDGRAILA